MKYVGNQDLNLDSTKKIVNLEDGTAYQDAATYKQVYGITSRGGGLVTNGTGIMNNNTGFTSLVFDGAEAPPGFTGSFRADGIVTVTGNELIPVNPNLIYQFRCLTKANAEAVSAGKTFYAGLICYDSDGYAITPSTFAYIGNRPLLTRSYTPNADTYIYVNANPTWNLSTSLSYQKGFLFFNYVKSNGSSDPFYSRNRIQDAWSTAPSITNMGGGEWRVGPLTPGSVVQGGSAPVNTVFPIGTMVGQMTSGGSYSYIGASGQALTTSWAPGNQPGLIGGMNTGGYPDSLNFSPGTAYVSVLFLMLYNSPTGTMKNWVSGIDFRAVEGYELTPVPYQEGFSYTITTAISALTDLDTTVTGAQLNAIKAKVDVIDSNQWKEACGVASTANINLASAPATIDGFAMNVVYGEKFNRVLVKNQTDPNQNGVYNWNGAGVAMTRTIDMDTQADVVGAVTTILFGTVNTGTTWQTMSNIVVGSSPMVWTRFNTNDYSSSQKSYSGTSITLDLLAANQTPIFRHVVTPTAAATITLPDCNTAAHPGRMTLQVKNTSAYVISLAGTNWVLQPNVNLSAVPQPVFDLVWDHVSSKWRVGDIGIDPSVEKAFTKTDITGNGVQVTWPITHNLNSGDLLVRVRSGIAGASFVDGQDFIEQNTSVTTTGFNTISITFEDPIPNAVTWQVTLIALDKIYTSATIGANKTLLAGNGSQSNWTVRHNLNSGDIITRLRAPVTGNTFAEGADFVVKSCSSTIVDLNTIDVAVSPAIPDGEIWNLTVISVDKINVTRVDYQMEYNKYLAFSVAL